MQSTTSMLINASSTISFDLNSPNLVQLLNILSISSNDLSGCLQNCSFSGICTYFAPTGSYICSCFSNFVGKACQLDTRPCSSSPCLNNSTCLNNLTNGTYSFQCECLDTFYGINCQNQINICQNKSCHAKGYCYKEENLARCKCFTGYSGDECEIESSLVKIIQNVQLTSTIICFLIMGSLITIIISNDVWNFFIGRMRLLPAKKKIKKIIRFKYHNKKVAMLKV